MSGGAWVAAHEIGAVLEGGNDGKWHCRPTLFRGHYFKSVTWAGSAGEGEPLGVCLRSANAQLTLQSPSKRILTDSANRKIALKVSQTWR